MPKAGKKARAGTAEKSSPYSKPSSKSTAAHSIFKMDKDLGQHVSGYEEME
jgi:18S rRNA (adenine1779-N6/adenine1780-N6)-dimethyltransferase